MWLQLQSMQSVNKLMKSFLNQSALPGTLSEEAICLMEAVSFSGIHGKKRKKISECKSQATMGVRAGKPLRPCFRLQHITFENSRTSSRQKKTLGSWKKAHLDNIKVNENLRRKVKSQTKRTRWGRCPARLSPFLVSAGHNSKLNSHKRLSSNFPKFVHS